MSFENDKDVERRRKSETASVSRASKENGIKKKKDPATAEVGNALRTARSASDSCLWTILPCDR